MALAHLMLIISTVLDQFGANPLLNYDIGSIATQVQYTTSSADAHTYHKYSAWGSVLR